jgi:two-component system, sensor histidine kinase and response regulator
MGGCDATRQIRLRQTNGRTPIIGLTASASEADRRMCIDAGMDDYVSKPFDIETLLSAFGRCLEMSATASVPTQ